jgi:hypothetical protein
MGHGLVRVRALRPAVHRPRVCPAKAVCAAPTPGRTGPRWWRSSRSCTRTPLMRKSRSYENVTGPPRSVHPLHSTGLPEACRSWSCPATQCAGSGPHIPLQTRDLSRAAACRQVEPHQSRQGRRAASPGRGQAGGKSAAHPKSFSASASVRGTEPRPAANCAQARSRNGLPGTHRLFLLPALRVVKAVPPALLAPLRGPLPVDHDAPKFPPPPTGSDQPHPPR